jgi:hypothetical protein
MEVLEDAEEYNTSPQSFNGSTDEQKDIDVDIVDVVGKHFIESNASKSINEWIKKKCLSINFDYSSTEEHSFEHTSYHEEFKRLYEETVESKIFASDICFLL